MSLILAIGMAGCTSFIRQPSTDGSDNGTVIAKSVVFNASSSNEEVGELSLKEAYAAVARTAVAIRVKTSSETSAGSGVIVDMSYEENAEANAVYIITCHHVISSKGDVTVYLPDENVSYENDDYTFTGTIGEESGAITLIGGDQSSDIAVLKLNLDKTATSGISEQVCKFIDELVEESYGEIIKKAVCIEKGEIKDHRINEFQNR